MNRDSKETYVRDLQNKAMRAELELFEGLVGQESPANQQKWCEALVKNIQEVDPTFAPPGFGNAVATKRSAGNVSSKSVANRITFQSRRSPCERLRSE
jgi:hypothetical protein